MVKSLFRIHKRTKAIVARPRFLEGIRVQDSKGNMVTISDYWRHKTVVLKVLRRFGCPLCRYESRLLSELRPEFDALGVRLVAVGFEECGFEDFIAGGYWDWEVLLDVERSIHTALGLKRVPVSVGLRDLISGASRSAMAASHRAGIAGDLRGDGFQLGGTFIIERATSKVLYEHRQAGFASYTSAKELYETCGGDPADVEEKAPRECLVYTSTASLQTKCI